LSIRTDLISPPPSTSLMSRISFLLAGMVLLIAAILKADQLAKDPFANGSTFLSESESIAGVFVELSLGALLLSGIVPQISRWAGIGCFSLFFLISVIRAVSGEVSCACFGFVTVSPWLTAILDLGLLILLFKAGNPRTPNHPLLRIGTAIVIVASFTWASVLLVNSNPNPERLSISPKMVELGSVERKQRIETSVTLSNTQRHDIAISTITSSCPCLTMSLAAKKISPGESIPGHIILDLSLEPNFTGVLAARVYGLNDEGQKVFDLPVRVTVQK
jgi:hypothetical protein